MSMTPEAFHTWSQRLRFTSETEALILGKREPAVHTMLSRAMNLFRQLYLHRSSTSSPSKLGESPRRVK